MRQYTINKLTSIVSKRIEVIENKLKRRFLSVKKRHFLEDELSALKCAKDSIVVLDNLSRYLDVEVIGDENNTSFQIISKIDSIQNIPSLESALLKHWKDEYGD